tara:strand:+ start:425 stop:1342 length:918 start_codon:yes stop_codon:yes gene_type:complete
MKSFIKKISFFIISLPILYLVLYISIDYNYNCKNDSDAIFVWGDSQTYQGINLQVIRDKTDKNIYSYAKHGAGVYDFLVFSEKVPKNTTIILGVSKPVQLRRKQNDRNMSGISIIGLLNLYRNGYTFQDIVAIVKKNKKPLKIRQEKTNMNKYNDSIVLKEPIELFEEIYAEIPSYLYEKQNLYKIGIKKLRDKNCNIIFIDFPYHSLLKEVENKSLIKIETEKLTNYIINSSNKIEIDTLPLSSKKQVMSDLTHLNEFGAEQVSSYISKKIRKYERTTMYIKNCRDSSKFNDCIPFEIYCKLKN